MTPEAGETLFYISIYFGFSASKFLMPHTDTNNLLRRNLIHWLKTNHLLITLIVFKLGDFSKS